MNFATWSIQNPIPPILLFMLLTLAGLYGFNKFTIQDLPDIEFPEIEVSLSLPGAVPSQLETEVARKVEDSIAGVSGVRHISTSITEGSVLISVTFVLEKAVSDALIETKDAVERIRSDLPADLESPIVSAARISNDSLMTYAVSSSSLNEEALSWFVDDTLGKIFMSVNGVGRFSRVGGVSREIRIEVDPVKLASLNVTAADVSEAVRRVQLESSGGRINIGQAEQSVRTIATAALASDLNALPVALPDGRYLRLDQAANISDTYAERTEAALLNGRESVAFRIYGSKGANEVKIAEDAALIIERLKQEYPDLTITPVVNSVTYTLEQYEGSMRMLYEGAVLAVIVVGFFLRDWRATIISASALPLSIIPTFGIMYWLGYSLNTLSLLALAVVVGILIDDAIVEVENIVRHKRMGKSTLAATKDAVNEIALAVISTTMTIVVVFLPTALMGGVTGLFFKQFGWTIVISVLMSLMVARLLTPLMAAYFLKNDSHYRHEEDGFIMRKYLDAVRWCLIHKKKTLFMAAAFFGVSLFLAAQLPAGFVPSSDQGYTNLSIELPPGSTLEDTLATTETVRKSLLKVKGIENIFAVAGSAEEGGVGDLRKGSMILTFLPKDKRPPQGVIDAEIRKILPEIPGAKFTLKNDGPGEDFSILLSGGSMGALTDTAASLEKELRGIKTLSNVNSTISLQRPEINIRPDFARAAELGITTEDIADTVRIATSGDFDPYLSKLNLDNRQIYIRVRMAEDELQDIDTIAGLRIPSRAGQTALSGIAEISIGNGPSQIDRYDRRRYVTVSADLDGMSLGQALEQAMALPSIANMPSGVKLIETGDAEFMNEIFSGFSTAMLTGVLCVFCVLVLLFKDFFQPVTILSALPLSFGGSIIALLIMDGEVNLPALIGIIMLMGIVTKNSILLVEYTIVGMKERGMERCEAVIDACHKRVRPIVMTTVAMIAGMAPIAIGMGGDKFRQPMAVAVIGGLITSTVLSLLIVPVVFTYINAAEGWFARRIRNINISPEESERG
ncbi:efflux RND transporter permease subunit [Geovibrio thiophilus]|uniref:Efflux RND transporter permease subunit n=1 Tax=Geovibrio thiophilus TaxID=139438 RepID=A0A3R5Y684_9BACT|nr:efflux RND transporter permease subunit [Geovibrio thiophilus]QAR32647.1 efflux RND transporter permease subunit [Geovibrio thiophilus]